MTHTKQRNQAHPPAETFAARIATGRAQYFVGRSRELKRWHDFIGPQNTQPLWFISGLGGIGKTILLRMFQADAIARGLHPVFLDADQIPANPQAVHSTLCRATSEAGARPLLLLDNFEYWQDLECWFRQVFLPAQPASLKIVFAGRRGLSPEWLTDAGWRPLVTASVLSPLSEAECRTYLWRRHVADARQQRLIDFSAGHPLALAKATDAAQAGRPVPDTVAEAGDELIRPLADCFSREATSDDQRCALAAAVVAREVNAPLLARMLAVDDATELLAWLSRLPCMEPSKNGLSLHPLVRDCLMHDMAERAPEQYRRLACRATDWVVDRLETSKALTWDAAAGLAEDAMHALRGAPRVRRVMTAGGRWPCQQSLSLDCYRPGDETAIHAMIARHEGETSLQWFQFWQQRAPDGVIVVRDAEQLPLAFLLKLDMETLDADAREADPLTRTLWQALQTQFTLRPGDHVPFIRHCIAHDGAAGGSAARNRLLMAILTYNLTAQNLPLSAQVFRDTKYRERSAAAMRVRPLDDRGTVIGDNRWRIYYHDWAVEPPSRYYRRLAARMLGCDSTSTGRPVDGSEPEMLDQSGFANAVDKALKHYQQPDKLRNNPLLGCALAAAGTDERADTATRIETLRTRLEAAVTALDDNSLTGQRQARVLRVAYLEPAASHKAAATTLHMGYSTFRRHLDVSRKALAAELWRREKVQR